MDQLNFTLVTHFFQYSVRVCLPELPAPMLKQALLWDLNHMATFVSNKIRSRVKHFQMSCSLIYIRLSPVSLFYKHLVPLKPRYLNQPLKKKNAGSYSAVQTFFWHFTCFFFFSFLLQCNTEKVFAKQHGPQFLTFCFQRQLTDSNTLPLSLSCMSERCVAQSVDWS